MKEEESRTLLLILAGVLIGFGPPALFREFQKAGIAGRGSRVGPYHQQDFFQKYEKGLDYQCGVPGSDSWKDRETGD